MGVKLHPTIDISSPCTSFWKFNCFSFHEYSCSTKEMSDWCSRLYLRFVSTPGGQVDTQQNWTKNKYKNSITWKISFPHTSQISFEGLFFLIGYLFILCLNINSLLTQLNNHTLFRTNNRSTSTWSNNYYCINIINNTTPLTNIRIVMANFILRASMWFNPNAAWSNWWRWQQHIDFRYKAKTNSTSAVEEWLITTNLCVVVLTVFLLAVIFWMQKHLNPCTLWEAEEKQRQVHGRGL